MQSSFPTVVCLEVDLDIIPLKQELNPHLIVCLDGGHERSLAVLVCLVDPDGLLAQDKGHYFRLQLGRFLRYPVEDVCPVLLSSLSKRICLIIAEI